MGMAIDEVISKTIIEIAMRLCAAAAVIAALALAEEPSVLPAFVIPAFFSTANNRIIQGRR